ncbi:HAD-like domain-containing protein [Mycena olivaceomarginata]|nr:HAD-like domain-containing protein [Mycena olivaceomarginata]
MESFANNGLRTLCVAWRVLGQEEYSWWGRIYDEATNRVEGRDEAIETACEQCEQNFTILGATALEDKLQEGVPEAIDTLHRAGIKPRILAGDKLQTATEIGYSCNLLKNDMDLMILSTDSQQQARAQIEAGLNKIASVLGPPSMDPRKRGFVPGAQASFAVVIDGDTLSHTLSPPLKEMFLNLGTQCETVVCCRVSPAQKALTVKLVKEGRNAMTLSIGDGANDVAMIQEANIGCGLFGLEGSQEPCKPEWVVLLRVRAHLLRIQTPKRGDHLHAAESPVEHRNDPQRAHGAGERHQPPNADVWDVEMNAMSSRGAPSAYAGPPSSAGYGGRSSQASYASHASYATAPEGSYGGHEDHIDAEMDLSRGQQQQYYAQGYQQGELDVHGYGHGAHDHDPNQRASRASEMSWDGPRAM